MSKSNMLLGLAKGKVGDLVFYRDGGEQRTRTRVIPKNPRSAAQMAQRVRLANVPAFYRVMQGIMKDSFSNRPSNQSGYNAFARGAIEVSPFLTKEMALAGSVLPAPYMVSRGVISPLPFTLDPSPSEVGVSVAIAGRYESEATVGLVSGSLLEAYPFLQQGDILTFANVVFRVDESSSAADAYSAFLNVVTFEIDTTSNELFSSTGLSANSESLSLKLPANSENFAGTIIVSRVLADGTLQTSTASLLLDDAASTLYENYRTENALAEAIASYGRGEESILR